MFSYINYTNSNVNTHCNVLNTCDMRHSEWCNTCKHNKFKENKNYYVNKNTDKTLWQKIYSLLGFKSLYEYDEYGNKYKTFYWVNKRFDLFSYVVKE